MCTHFTFILHAFYAQPKIGDNNDFKVNDNKQKLIFWKIVKWGVFVGFKKIRIFWEKIADLAIQCDIDVEPEM